MIKLTQEHIEALLDKFGGEHNPPSNISGGKLLSVIFVVILRKENELVRHICIGNMSYFREWD